MRWLYLVFKGLKRSPRFTIFFILNLSFGLSGFVALDIVQYSLDQSLKQRSKTLMSADLTLSSRRPIKDVENNLVLRNLNSKAEQSKVVQIYSMILNKKSGSRLVHIKAVQNNYPFYGSIHLKNQGLITRTDQTNLHKKKVVWVDPEILLQLKVQVGDLLQIGETSFTIGDVIEEDSSVSTTTSMAPRVYISHQFLENTKLIRVGSMSWFSILYKTPLLNLRQLKEKTTSIFNQLNDPQLKIHTHQNASQMTGRLLNYLNDFLALTSLCTLFLVCVGMGFLFHSYLKTKTREIAILLSLGVHKYKATGAYLLQIIFLGFISFIIACGVGWLLFFVMQSSLNQILPFELDIRADTFTFSIVLSLFIPILVCFPFLLNLRHITASLLLNESRNNLWVLDGVFILSVIPIILSLWGLAVWVSHSFYIGTLFSTFFLLSILFLAFIGWILLRLLSYLKMSWASNPIRWAVRDLSRHSFSTLACFLSIAVGILLLNLIPQIEASLAHEVENPDQSKMPSLFLFDIQDEQVNPLKKLVSKHQVQIDKIMPMMRTRLTHVNNKPFSKGRGREYDAITREQEREMRFRNRGFNISQRDFLYPSEKILSGEMWKGALKDNSKDLPWISIETRFANRLNFKINDVLTFVSEGRKFRGIVKNIRSVKWITFEPNFFILLQSHKTLDKISKTWIATIPQLPINKKIDMQNNIVSKLSNISIVDVSKVAQRILNLSQQMSLALKLMSFLCLIAGFIVLYSIVSYQIRTREWDIGLLKSLGCSFKDINILFLFQFGLIAFGACLLGLICSIILSFTLSYIFFYSVWVFSPYVPIGTFVIGMLLALIVVYFATRQSLNTSAKQLLS